MTARAELPAHPDPIGEQDISSVLRRSGAVCHDLASAVEWLQDQFGSLMDAGRLDPCREATIALQDLDRIAQFLHGLARLSIELGEHTTGRQAPRSHLNGVLRLDSLAEQILDGAESDEVEDEFWH